MPEQTTQNIYTQDKLPAWVQPYYETLATSAQDAAFNPYDSYGGQRIAGFDQMENAAMQGIGQLALSGGPSYGRDAATMYGQAGAGYQNMAGQFGNLGGGFGDGGNYGSVYNRAGNVGSFSDMSPDQMQSYMNPYTQNVTNVMEREARRMGDQQMSELGSKAAAGGAFGGYRHGLGEQNVSRGVRQDVNDIRAQGLERAYGQAQNMFNSDRNAQFRGMDTQMNALQGGINSLGQQGNMYQGMGNIAGGMGRLAPQEQDMLLQRMNALQGAGQQRRGLNQASMDMGYQDFLNQRGYGQEQMSWLGSILGQFPHQSNRQQTTQAQMPGAWQSMLGTGVASLGTYNALRN